MGGAAALALLVGAVLLRSKPPAVNVPVPEAFDRLEPQLREYLAQHLKWVQAAPRRAERHATLGLTYAVNSLWPEARQAFQNAALLDPREPLALMYVGVATQELGDLAEAITLYQQLTNRFPAFAPGFYRLGYALLGQGRVEEAERAYRRLTELAPKEWRGFAGLGETLARRGQFSNAVEYLEKAVQLDFTALTAHHLLGQAYQKIGRAEEAKLELQLSRNAVDSPMPDDWIKVAWQHVRVLQEQARLAAECLETGEPDKAVAILGKARAYHSDNVSLMNQLAIALNQSDQPEQARQILLQALQKESNFVPALVTLSYSQQKLDDLKSALASAERAVALAPEIPQGHIAKANALLAMERDAEAVATLESAAKLDPKNAEIPMQIGDILWRNLSQTNEAKARYETARQMDPGLVPVYVRLADLYLQLGDPQSARNCLAKLDRLSRNLPDLKILEQRLRRLEAR